MEKNIELEHAVELIRKHAKPVSRIKRLPITEALNYRLSGDLFSPLDNPPFNRSPLDGFTFNHAGSEAGKKLKIIGCVYAGEAFEGYVKEGEAVRIMTGAPIPEGCDCVIRLEDCTWDDQEIMLPKAMKAYENYCFKGEDYTAQTVMIHKGKRLGPVHLGIIASMGIDQIMVYDAVRVGLLVSGSEIVQPGSALGPGKIYDTNLTLLTSVLASLGMKPVLADFVCDEAEAVSAKIKAMMKECDCIITTGGVSVGDKDIFHEVVQLLDAEQLFWRVKLKPGTPAMFSMVEGCPLLSLSGNPFAALVTFDLMGRELLAVMSGNEALVPKRQTAILKQPFQKRSGNRRFIRAQAVKGKVMINSDKHSSGMLASMLGCNCLIDIAAGSEGLKAGETVKIVMLEENYE